MRLGLGLSGGGFRASFYHLGVLAQMADRDLLRHVQVISTVSGGSIIGALYYVYLKELLESKYDREVQGKTPDELISQKDYVDLVKDMSEQFRKAVQTNIRLQTFSNPFKNLKMVLPHYSRSDRIAELYDALLYSPALGLPKGKRANMSDLYIQPKGIDGYFRVEDENAKRGDKIPVLLLNGTTLNTGHNWRFEAKTMGEPESSIPGVDKNVWSDIIDKNLKLERPDEHKNYKREERAEVRLGPAVAASATVPGLFPPMSISNMYYPEDFRIQVVDGGVHDNQGILALEARKCDHFIISDSSGQMRDAASPSPSAFSVLARSNSIMMDRIREEQLFRLIQRVDNDKVAYMSLWQGLPRKEIPYINQSGKPNSALKHWPDFQRGLRTRQGIEYHAQDLLSQVRTDLDSFTDIEAFSLMANGYAIAIKEFADKPPFNSISSTSPVPSGLSVDPRFQKCMNWLQTPNKKWEKHMEIAGETVLKVFRQMPILGVLIIALLGALLYFAWPYIHEFLHQPMWKLVTPLLIIGLGLALPWLGRTFKIIKWLTKPGEWFRRLILQAIIPFFGGIVILVYLHTLDKLFVQYGKLEEQEK